MRILEKFLLIFPELYGIIFQKKGMKRMTDTILYNTTISPYANPDNQITLPIPLGPNNDNCSHEDFLNAIRNGFKEEIDSGVIKVLTKNTKDNANIQIKGIVFWDDLPVVDLRFYFEENIIDEIRAEVFSLGKTDEVLSKPVLADTHIFCSAEETLVVSEFDREKGLYDVSLHTLNTFRQYVKTGNKQINVRLRINNDFINDVSYAKAKETLAQGFGFPVILKKDDNEFLTTSLSCKEIKNQYIEKTDDGKWVFKYPAFITLLDGFFVVKEMSFYTNRGAEKKSIPKSCQAIYLNLEGDETDTERLYDAEPNTEIKPKAINLYSSAGYAVRNIPNYKLLVNPNEFYPLAIIPK